MKRLRDEHVFLIAFAITAAYFSGVMIRLILTLTPVVCISAAIAVSDLLDTFLRFADGRRLSETSIASPIAPMTEQVPPPATRKEKKLPKSGASTGSRAFNPKIIPIELKIVIVSIVTYLLLLFGWHATWVTSSAYSSPSVVLSSRRSDGSPVLIDDFREGYYWLWQNTPEDAKIMAWWDYGYQIAGMANRTTITDNNTWNNTHIATVGRILASSEEDAYPLLSQLGVNYVLVIFGGVIGYSGDDINKFLWMIRIAQGVFPAQVKESAFYNSKGEYRVDQAASPTMKNSLMYKMSYHGFSELTPQGSVDRVRQMTIPPTPIDLETLEEVFTSENWIVRIYKVLEPDAFGRIRVKKTRNNTRKAHLAKMKSSIVKSAE